MDIETAAQKIWDYHLLGRQLKPAEVIMVLGSNDTRLAGYAADLFFQGYAPVIIFSGGVGRLTRDLFDKPEAEVFAEIALARGVPKDKILIENKSTNTGENIEFTKKLLAEKGLNFNSFILIQKPYMERRTYATFKKVWPEKEFIVTSPPITFTDYPNQVISRDQMINVMVGDLQRIKIYPDLGFQIFQEIPADVWAAYEYLVTQGYTSHVFSDEQIEKYLSEHNLIAKKPEMITIIDEHDQIIGSKPRNEIDYRKDIYRNSALWLTNSKGEILLAQRKLTKDKDPGKWGPAVAGTVAVGETYEQNIYKEAEEEIGLTGVDFKLGPKQYLDYPRKSFTQWFVCQVDKKIEDFMIEEKEVEQLKWIDQQELIEDVKRNTEKYVPSMPSLLKLLYGDQG